MQTSIEKTGRQESRKNLRNYALNSTSGISNREICEKQDVPFAFLTTNLTNHTNIFNFKLMFVWFVRFVVKRFACEVNCVFSKA